MNQRVRLFIVDDHAIVREGLRTLLSEEAEIEVVGEATSGSEAVRLALVLKPQVVLMDLIMAEMDGIEATRQIRQVNNTIQVIALTSFADDQRIRNAIQAGAIGFLLKDVLKPDLVRAIQAAARGEPTLHPEAQRALMRQATAPSAPFAALTDRERDVLRLIAQGKSNKEIAATLFLTEGTVKGYVSLILDKLQVDDRTQAALYAVRHGLEPNR